MILLDTAKSELRGQCDVMGTKRLYACLYIFICVHVSLNPDRPGDLKEMFDFRPNEVENKVRINKCFALHLQEQICNTMCMNFLCNENVSQQDCTVM